MSDKKTSEQQFISGKDSEEWSQVLHGEIEVSSDDEAHKEAELVRKYLIARDEAKAVESLPDVDVLNTLSPEEARVIYQKASKEIHNRSTTWLTRFKSFAVPLIIGGLSAAVVVLFMQKNREPDPVISTPNTVLNTEGYSALARGALPEKYPNMLLIPGGVMRMGCTKGWDDVVGGCRSNEHPVHPVELKPYEFAQHEVTKGQCKYFVDATNYKTDAEIENRGWVHQDMSQPSHPWVMNPELNWRNPGFEQDETHPVTCVSWNDAQEYIKWLNKETKRQYRLPSETEWEFAARGGKSTAYFWGAGGLLHTWANLSGDKDGWPHTAVVGSFPANSFWVQDTSGNVWEWVQDCWHKTYQGAPSDGSAWETECTSLDGKTRRGGGWDGIAAGARSAIRSVGSQSDRSNLYGFRIAHDYIEK